MWSCRSPKQEATRTRSCTISNHTGTRISVRSRRPCSLLRTPAEAPANSVNVGDTFNRQPTQDICEKRPPQLVRNFMVELEKRGRNQSTGRVHARGRGPAPDSAAHKNRGKVRPGACCWVQLRELDLNLIKGTLRGAPC